MKLINLILLACCTVFAASTAIAQDVPPPAKEFTATDATLSYLSGALVGTAAAAGTSYLLMSFADCGPENMCLGESIGGLLGSLGAFAFATPLGIHWYGEYANLQGDYWSAFWGTIAGASAGVLVSLGVSYGLDGNNSTPGLLAIPLLATAGGVWSYSASTPDSQTQARTQHRVGLPMVSYTNNNGKQLMLHLMGGQF